MKLNRLLLLTPLALLASCSLFQESVDLNKAIDYISQSDIPPDLKAVIIEAMRAAVTGGDLKSLLATVANGAITVIAAYFGVTKVPKLFKNGNGNGNGAKPAATPPVG